MNRRHFVTTLATVPVAGLAGCSDGESAGTPTTTATGTETETATATSTDGATESPTGTETPTAADTETVTDTPTATDTETVAETTTPTPTATETATGTPTATATPVSSRTVQVAPGRRAFSPKSFELAVGGTVEWVWEADGHNVVVDARPAGSDWEGTPGDTEMLYDEGYTHEYTFEVPGTYEYYCSPHRSLGMTGSFEVVE